MTYDFLRRIGLCGLSRGSRLPAEALGPDEWGVSALARRLGMPADTLGHWCARGWVEHRKLPGVRGCLVLWADEAEHDRLGRLRAFRPSSYPPVYPAELTTPQRCSDSARSESVANSRFVSDKSKGTQALNRIPLHERSRGDRRKR